MKRILIGLVMFGIIMGISGMSSAESRRSGIPNQMNQIISGDKKPDVKDLIQQLGDDDYQKRESAGKELAQLGDRLIVQYRRVKLDAERQTLHSELQKLSEALREGAQSKDPEIKMRANNIRQHFYTLLQSKIAFEANVGGKCQIYVMDSDGKNQTRLTENKAHDKSPVWSPDGTKIAFVSMRGKDSKTQIYVMDSDGKNETRLTENESYDNSPTWSPDGKKIAFASRGDESNVDIYVMDSDGKNQTRLTENMMQNNSPTWSPDGTKIAFASDRDINNNHSYIYQIYVMDPDGKNQTRLTDSKLGYHNPAWSPISLPELTGLFATLEMK